MTIKAHCMGMPFPKRGDAFDRFLEGWENALKGWAKKLDREIVGTPSAADLDAVAEEQKAKEKTSGKTDRSQP